MEKFDILSSVSFFLTISSQMVGQKKISKYCFPVTLQNMCVDIDSSEKLTSQFSIFVLKNGKTNLNDILKKAVFTCHIFVNFSFLTASSSKGLLSVNKIGKHHKYQFLAPNVTY